jgi:hypothetical protein
MQLGRNFVTQHVAFNREVSSPFSAELSSIRIQYGQRYGLEDLVIENRFPAGSYIFFFSISSRPMLEPCLLPVQHIWVYSSR